METNTEQKALLRYLYLREEFLDPNADLLDVFDELDTIDKETNGVYGLSDVVNSPFAQGAICFMDQSGLLTFKPENPHVELTFLGRVFANKLNFPKNLEDLISLWLKSKLSSTENS